MLMSAPPTDLTVQANGSPAKACADADFPRLTRAEGRLRIAFKRRGDKTVLNDLYQQGCLKARFPSLDPAAMREGVLINTAGGLTDGDRLQQELIWGENTSGCLTGQAAERIYRSRRAAAEIDTSLELKQGATGYWLPQETILFNGGHFVRRNNIEMQAGSRLIATESLVFGRTAMQEDVSEGELFENWRIRYDNRLVFADGLRLAGNIRAQLKRSGIGDGSRAIATLLYIGMDADRFEIAMKERAQTLATDDVRTGCSLLPNVLHMRVLASEGEGMRHTLSELIKTLGNLLSETDDYALPRVWQC